MQAKDQDYSDRSDSNQQTFESRVFKIIREFSQFAKAMNEEQNNINSNVNNTINTVNMLIDQLEENKAALSRAEDEIENLKSEIQELKEENSKPRSNISTRSVNLASNYNPPDSSTDFTDEINTIKTEISKLKENLPKSSEMQHDINCLKYEVKRIKHAPHFPELENNNNAIIQRSASNSDLTAQINDLKRQIEDIKKPKKKNSKKLKFGFGKKKDKRISLSDDERVESKYFESSSADETETRENETAIIDKMNIQQNSIDMLKSEVKSIQNNNVSSETVKKMKRQIKKLKKRTDILENKILGQSKESDDSETTMSKTIRSDESSFESKTQEASE